MGFPKGASIPFGRQRAQTPLANSIDSAPGKHSLMHHRLLRFHRFAPELPADANGAEASAPLELQRTTSPSPGRRIGGALVGLALAVLTLPQPLWSQVANQPNQSNARSHILGRVADQTGKPLVNLEIVIKDGGGNPLRTVRTNNLGRYCFTDMATGHYLLTQDPSRAPFDGQTVVTSLPPEGLYIDWRVAGNSAIALASTPRQAYGCPQFLAGDTLLEKIFGVVSNDMLAGGSIAAGLGVAAGTAAGSVSNGRPFASPSQ
jgi:hypothetical protein